MEVPIPPERQARLSQLAAEKGYDAGTFASKIIGDYFEKLEHFEAAVLEGEAALDRGEYITHEDLKAEVENWSKS